MSSKKYKNGLCLGKFLPPHKGHLHLIETAASMCEQVHVLVCHLKNEPIHGKLRVMWLKEIFNDNENVTIVECDDENPQHPTTKEYDHNFYRIWFESVYSRIESLDAVFTSEEYGDDFARCLGVTHELVDLGRITVPVSGTKVRNYPEIYMDYLPENVKAYFTPKVAIVGPESTGKSTLVGQLTELLGCHKFDEYGREYTDKFHSTTEMVQGDYEQIALTHFYGINSGPHDNLIISDTEAIVTLTFGKMFLGEDFHSDLIDSIIAKQKYEFYILLRPDVKWVDDGTRELPKEEDRWKHFDLIEYELVSRGLPYYIIDGNYEDRLYGATEVFRFHSEIYNKILVS